MYCLIHAQRLFVPTLNLSHTAKSEWTHTTLHQRLTTAVIMDMTFMALDTEHARTPVIGMESHQSVERVRDHYTSFFCVRVPASYLL